MDVGTAAVLFDVIPDHRSLTAGAALFRQGDTSFGIFLLVNGRIRLQRITPDGAAVSIHLARPGELFAEASLFSERYHCDAVAEVGSEVWAIRKSNSRRACIQSRKPSGPLLVNSPAACRSCACATS